MSIRDKIIAKTNNKRSIDQFEEYPALTGFEMHSGRIDKDLAPYIEQHRIELSVFVEFNCRANEYSQAREHAEHRLAHTLYKDQHRLLDELISSVYGGNRNNCLEIIEKLKKSMSWD